MKTRAGSKAEHKPEAEHRYGKHSPVLSFAIAWVGYLGEAAPSWELLGVSVIGTGAESWAKVSVSECSEAVTHPAALVIEAPFAPESA